MRLPEQRLSESEPFFVNITLRVYTQETTHALDDNPTQAMSNENDRASSSLSLFSILIYAGVRFVASVNPLSRQRSEIKFLPWSYMVWLLIGEVPWVLAS
jgi:hypothetical protein